MVCEGVWSRHPEASKTPLSHRRQEHNCPMTKRKKRILVWTFALLGVPIIWCAGVAIAIVRAGEPNSSRRADIAIVLGAAVWGDKPSPVFAARIDHAVTLFKNGQVKGIIFTGGRADGDRLSESRTAAEYAVARGVPRRAIYCEEVSTNTYGNLENAKGILQRLGLRKVLIVSDPFHLLRAGMIADRLAIEHELSPTPSSRYVSFGAKASQVSREIYFVTRLLLKGS
jgi:uncharacterized SAM-binding protein YcdF (DUF218 family)